MNNLSVLWLFVHIYFAHSFNNYSMQYQTYSIKLTVSNLQYTTYSIQLTVYNLQYTTYSIQLPFFVDLWLGILMDFMVLMKAMVQDREITMENVAGDLPGYAMMYVGYMVFVAWGKRTWTS